MREEEYGCSDDVVVIVIVVDIINNNVFVRMGEDEVPMP